MRRPSHQTPLLPRRDRTLKEGYVVIAGVVRRVLVRWLYGDTFSVRWRESGPEGYRLPAVERKLLQDRVALAELERDGLTVV